MKMKSFALIALAGALSASLAYVSPVFADMDDNIGMQNDSGMGDGMSMNAPNDTSGMNGANDTNDTADNSGNNAPSNNNAGEQATPDTATGDDDY